MISNEQNDFFIALSNDRLESANMLEKPSMRGIKNSVVEKYSDQAHFIYELLQNADDANATSARFILFGNKLVFAHNGTRRFSVSNPKTEETDSENGQLGDINAITSIANSNKTIASIGKFGVGFKAVFQYTQTPEIYDPDVFFKIERFIVPIKMDDDFVGRGENETLFVFPFDHSERTAQEAYADISEKLRALVHPILFLTNLKDISFEYADKVGLYGKNIERTLSFDDTKAELICLTQNDGDDLYDSRLWLFSRTQGENLKYSVGFCLNEEGHLSAADFPAFCFFPTKEVTKLNFIIHAPFLLTDSREGIRAGVPHNKVLIEQLSELAADALLFLKKIGEDEGVQLISDAIFDIIPYDESQFNNVDDRNKISFKPFYTAIETIFENEKILPSYSGYVNRENAYWASVPRIASVFSNVQLAFLTADETASWVFTSFGRDETQRGNDELADYIDDIIEDWIDENRIINKITKKFIELQSVEWLHSFYKWVSEATSRTKAVRNKPIFLNQKRSAVSAFDSKGQAVLFLPTEDESGYDSLFLELMDNTETVEFIRQLGITEPSLRDEIYNIILPQYNVAKGLDTNPHFIKFFKYYKECPQAEQQKFIGLIKDYQFIRYQSTSDKTVYRGKGSDLYFPHQSLLKYFEAKPDAKFVLLDEYKALIGESDEEILNDFLIALGVVNSPRIITRELGWREATQIKATWSHASGYQKWTENYIDGCKEIVDLIIENSNENLSLVLWAQLIKLIARKNSWKSFDKIICGEYSYKYYSFYTEYFDSKETIRLRTEPWLLNTEGVYMPACDLQIQTLSPIYDTTSDEAKELLDFLCVADSAYVEEEYESLTDEQRRKIELANKIEAAGLTEDELETFLRECRLAKQYLDVAKGSVSTGVDEADVSDGTADAPLNPSVARITKEIARRVSAPSELKKTANIETPPDISAASDEDEYTKPSIDYSKKIEQAKQQSADEIERIMRLEELTAKATESDKYTFGWFKALLELEAINSGESNANSREISISFAKVEREGNTERTLILKHPSRYIPQFMEDLANIPLRLINNGQEIKKVEIEVVSVKSYTLRVKLRSNAEIDGVNLSTITEARIIAQNPVFLLDELKKQFCKLDFEDDYNMKDHLCENIEFVFGPPGTGKTTHLASEVLLPLMRNSEDVKVLVLTPTNKAADVLVARIMQCMDGDNGYKNWLIRFGATADSGIEQSGVFRDKTFDIRTFPRNITVTTIARFPYDFFLPNDNTRLHLSALKWDYIIIDEASMIPLVNIIYPLYKKTPEKFIIAGDPFQIEPITSVDMWKDENIYTLVELNSFTTPTTVPHPYHIELLTTQYRSIPAIGEVFSRFAYGGVLSHHRDAKSQRPLLLNGFVDVKALNIIKFPVHKYESIYRPKKLQGRSNYQVYSALFAFEFVKHISVLLDTKDEGVKFKIGVIAPYRAEADLIDKLMSAEKLPENIDVQVGTIHGFQGDECDIIVSVFNPPPTISASHNMFLNKSNIINVSVSRAKDYLFILMPDDDTENVNNLTLVKRIERLCKEQLNFMEISSSEIELAIFDSHTYLEDNSFSTSHQLVNVYGKPERRYEVRSEDDAIDVQIHNS